MFTNLVILVVYCWEYMISRLFFPCQYYFWHIQHLFIWSHWKNLTLRLKTTAGLCLLLYNKCWKILFKTFLFSKKDFWRARIRLNIKHRITSLQFVFAVISIDIFGLKSFEASPRFNAISYPRELQNTYVTDENVLFFISSQLLYCRNLNLTCNSRII